MTRSSEELSTSSGAAIGVDGGAGRLKFAVRRLDGGVAHHHAPGANPALVGMREFVARLETGIRGALQVAELGSDEVMSAGLGLSGVDRQEQIEYLDQEIRKRILPACHRIWVGNDAMAALRQGAGRLEGIVLIAGTGSICYGVDSEGNVARVGGWGGELGDEGSAFWIGQKALQSACRMADGREGPSALLDVVLHELELETPLDLIAWTSRHTREAFKQETAELFPAVASLGAGGDLASRAILESALEELLQHVEAIGEKFHDNASPPLHRLVCAGGIFAGNEAFYLQFCERLRMRLPSMEPTRLLEPASLGALALGCEQGA